METSLILFGIFLVLQTGWSQDDKLILSVDPPMVEAKPGQELSLVCIGDKNEVTYYISNLVKWTHRTSDGNTVHKLTTGFYLDTDGDQTKYEITHGASGGNYAFNLKIFSVTDADDGTYICEHVVNNQVKSFKEVKFTVLNPVEMTKLILDSTGFSSTSDIMPGSPIYEVDEGSYEVKCIASGSNPKPKLSLMVNGEMSEFDVVSLPENTPVGNRPSYKQDAIASVKIDAENGEDQTVKCSGGLPGNQYPPKVAGLKLKVKSLLPDVMFNCRNESALKGYRQTELSCDLHSKNVLDCLNINWESGTDNFIIYPANKTLKDPVFGIMMSKCKVHTHENGTTLTTSLTIEDVDKIHFDTIFYVEYSVGKSPHRHPVKLYMKESSGAAFVKPLCVLLCTLLAILVRRFNREQ